MLQGFCNTLDLHLATIKIIVLSIFDFYTGVIVHGHKARISRSNYTVFSEKKYLCLYEAVYIVLETADIYAYQNIFHSLTFKT